MTTKIHPGGVFSVKIDDYKKKYFQYLADDQTQLNSNVICIFRTTYNAYDDLSIDEIVNDEIDFFAHVLLKMGIKQNFWNKAGQASRVIKPDVLFRDSTDYGNPQIKVSFQWWVWRINEDQRFVGKLDGINIKSEIGIVVNPQSIVSRMKTGKYDFVYPTYE